MFLRDEKVHIYFEYSPEMRYPIRVASSNFTQIRTFNMLGEHFSKLLLTLCMEKQLAANSKSNENL